jgi:hypothetical protein
MAVQDQKDHAWGVVQQPTAEVDEHRAVQVAVVGGKAQLAFGGDGGDEVTAEMRLTPNRSPVVATTGVWPTGAQVVPAR